MTIPGLPNKAFQSSPFQRGGVRRIIPGMPNRAWQQTPWQRGGSLAIPPPKDGGSFLNQNGTASGLPMTPAAPAAPAAPGTQKPGADPRDSTFFSNVAQGIFNRSQGLGQLAADDTYDQTANDNYLGQLARQQVKSRQNTTQDANKQGLFYSGILGKRLGEVDQGYADERTTAAAKLAKAIGDRGRTRQGLIKQYGDPSNPDDYGLNGASELAAAGERRLGDPVAPQNIVDQGTNDPGGAPDVGFAKGVSLGAGWKIRRDPVTGRAIGLIPPGGQ